MFLIDFIELFTDWNSYNLVVNDDNLDCIYSGSFSDFFKFRLYKEVYHAEVVAFNLIDNDFCVRINMIVDKKKLEDYRYAE